ncbi:MAG TPA: enolase C-terminal domain-like protein [Roseiflexaceae bacterium]|nr:enolase C-terminal domain-like protein [Roseiflexaceae bacterium]
MSRIDQVNWLPFRLPYRTVFATAHGAAALREGVLLRLEAGGLTGLGEASPVRAFGGGTAADALELLAGLAPRLRGLTLEEAEALLVGLPDLPGGAAVACGLDTALCDLRARMLGLPLATLLVREAEQLGLGGRLRRAVAVNATVGAADTAVACGQAGAAAAAGFGCVKLKVGVCPSDGAELERIAAVRATLGPDLRLRLDANGAWAVEQAIRILRAAARYGLELVEQPVAADDLAGMALVRARCGVPVAADEPVGTPAQARRVLAADAADLLVVKPMLAGGQRPALAVAALARQAGCGAIVTTTIDSGVGNTAALHLAAALPPETPACGLATGALLEADLTLDAPQPQAGLLALPDAPGLGIALHAADLARYGSGWRSA